MNFLKLLFALLISGTYSNIRDDFKARQTWGGGGGSGDPAPQRDDLNDDKIDGSGDDDGEEKKPSAPDKPDAKPRKSGPELKSADDLIKEAESRESQQDEPFTADELVETFINDSKAETGKVFEVDGQKMDRAGLLAYTKDLDENEAMNVRLSYKGREIPMETLVEAVEKLEDDSDDDDTITIGKKTVTAEEFDKLVPAAAKFYGVDISKYPEGEQMKLLEKYLDLKEGSKVVNDRHQDNARTKRELENMRQQLESDKAELERERTAIEKEKENLENKKKKAKETLDLDPDDELDDIKKAKIISKQAMAERDLEDATDEEKRIKQRETQLQSYQIAIFVAENTTELQSEFPELRTKKSAEDIIDVFDNTGDYEDDADLTRALRIREVLNRYADLPATARQKTPITKFYAKLKNSLTEIKPAQSSKPVKNENSNNNKPKTRKLSLADLVNRAFTKQKNTPRDPKGGSSRRHSNESQKPGRDPNYAQRTGWKREGNMRVTDDSYDLDGAIKDHKEFLGRKRK